MDWIEATATIVQAVAVAAAGYAAWRGLTTWRHEMTTRRRAELAEHTLAMFYEARDIIEGARFPGHFGDEGSSRERQSDETEDETSYRNAIYVPVERLTRHVEFWGRFDAARYPFMAIFGEEAAKPFKTVRAVKVRVIVSARSLLQTHGRAIEEREDYQGTKERLENYIGRGLSEEDELAGQVDCAVSAIEEICRPAIVGTGR